MILSFVRKYSEENFIVVIANFTPVLRYDYRLGVPFGGTYTEILNSDDSSWGGSGETNIDLLANEGEWHGQPFSLKMKLPPLGTIYLRLKKEVSSQKTREDEADD